MSKEQFSYFLPPISQTVSQGDLTLEEVWEYLTGRKSLDVWSINPKTKTRTYKGSLQDLTKKVRSMSKEEYGSRDKGKTSLLPLCTFGGTFLQREGDKLIQASGLICLDIDKISSQEGVSLEDLKERISQDREIGVRLVFTSPSGDGLKIVCKTSGQITDRDSYKKQFNSLNSFVSQKYSVSMDDSTSDITRGCLLCYDPGAILQTWEDTYNPKPLQEKERVRPQRREIRGDFSPWDWDRFKEETLIPAVYDCLDLVFPDMDFTYTGRGWESPLKLDGSPAKSPRKDKTIVSEKIKGVILEQGGKATPVIDFYMTKNNLPFGEAIRLLSEISGVGAEYGELSRKYAQMKERERNYMNNRPTTKEERVSPIQTSTVEAPEVRFKEFTEVHSLKEISSTKREGIKTGYQFKDSQGREEALVLPSGALTLICGRSSHGKTRLLQNLSLQIAKAEEASGGEGVVLYFSFEESLLEVAERVANIAVNKPQLSQYGTKNTEVLRDYFRTGTLNKSPEAVRTEVSPRLSEFETLYNSGRLRIYYTPDLYSGDLCRVLEYLSSQMSVKAVFLDYVQAIYKEGYRKDRREELREICKELNDVAISLDVPIVLSAQLNRETPNPSEMSGDNIAESADITRYANTILLLWDSSKARDIRGGLSSYLNTAEGKRLQERGFRLGERGKLYAVLSKNRGGTPDVECILDYVPETGKVLENEDLPEDTPGGTGNVFNL